jgi:hypothetical protein
MLPVGSLVTDAAKAIPFYKGFQQMDGVSVFLHPVPADPSGDSP